MYCVNEESVSSEKQMFTHHKPEILFRQKLKLLQPCAIDGSYYMEIILKNETY